VRIGELAREAGTTPRTVRYYEEIGLLPSVDSRSAGEHREYGSADLEQLLQVLRLKDLLGLSLDELRDVIHGEAARPGRRRSFHETSDPVQRERIRAEATAHVDRLLGLVARRRGELEILERELLERRERAQAAETA
jgi:DNA-binding transcriptional MerR regulator